MIVTVVDREAMSRAWGHGLNQVITRTVRIADRCPICGRYRGKPNLMNFRDDGESYAVHVWNNPCGHIDHYDKVLLEADGK